MLKRARHGVKKKYFILVMIFDNLNNHNIKVTKKSVKLRHQHIFEIDETMHTENKQGMAIELLPQLMRVQIAGLPHTVIISFSE